MNALIGEIGKRLPDRWLARVLLPGLAWTIIAVAAWHIGQAGAQHLAANTAWVTPLMHRLTRSPTNITTAIVLLLAAAISAGWAAQAAAAAVQAVWLGRWRGWAACLADWLTDRRRTRAKARAANSNHPPIEAYLPERPTWIGDRFRVADARIYAQYWLYLALIWPRLWLLLDPSTRDQIRATRDRYDATVTLAAWSLPYLALTVIAWPCAILAIGIAITGWWQTRASAAALTDMVEAVVDIHHPTLAAALGHPLPTVGINPEIAAAINDQLNKGA